MRTAIKPPPPGNAKEGPRDPNAEPSEQFNEFCREPPCASDGCRKAKRCLHE